MEEKEVKTGSHASNGDGQEDEDLDLDELFGGSDEDESSEDDDVEKLRKELQKAKQKASQQEGRARKYGKKLKERSEKLTALEQEVQRLQERLDEAELRARGFTSKEEIEFARKAAKALGVPITEALEDEIVIAKLEKIKNQREAEESSIDHQKDGGESQRPQDEVDVERAIKEYEKTGKLPKDRKLRSKILDRVMRG